ncbi:MAG: 6-hydroxymethylpterin diphosphokinase MptE-like protein [Thermoplasmata archaeon]
MEYVRWAPTYERIRAEFDFDLSEEARAADDLLAHLAPAAQQRPLERLGRRLAGRDAIVVGLAPGAGPPPIWTLPASDRPPALVAADGAAEHCLRAGLVPDVVTTDLDGPVPSEITANQRGSLVVVHAHGDNRPALRAWVSQFEGELAGSWSGPPRPGLFDVGGFTDGDRAAYLAQHVGARRILLWGFDFRRSDERDPSARARKVAKLRWAERLLDALARSEGTPVLHWRRDGTLEPFRLQSDAESTT